MAGVGALDPERSLPLYWAQEDKTLDEGLRRIGFPETEVPHRGLLLRATERPQEPSIRLPCRHQQQLPCLPDEEGVRADPRRRVARKLRRVIQ